MPSSNPSLIPPISNKLCQLSQRNLALPPFPSSTSNTTKWTPSTVKSCLNDRKPVHWHQQSLFFQSKPTLKQNSKFSKIFPKRIKLGDLSWNLPAYHKVYKLTGNSEISYFRYATRSSRTATRSCVLRFWELWLGDRRRGMVIPSPRLSQVWFVQELGEFLCACTVLWSVLCLTMLTNLLIKDENRPSSWNSSL